MSRSDSPRPTYEHERQLIARHGGCVCGIDEAGRGPLAGPVVAAAVILDEARIPDGLNDSKKLTEAARERLHDEITASAVVGIAMADAERIDSDNILRATLWAMREATLSLKVKPASALIDGNQRPLLPCAAQTLVKGDSLSLSIAAASIIAKVTRDRLMCALASDFPQYGFERHKGYGTPAHLRALRLHGPCVLHRRSFSPVRQLCRKFDDSSAQSAR